MNTTPNEPRFVTCPCQHCSGNIEFDASGFQAGETRSAECPHCHLETVIFVPPSAGHPPTPPPIPKPTPAVVSFAIGDILIIGDQVMTPNGTGTLADSQWIFSDMSRTEARMPPTAIILAIVFALLCLLGLLFLLMKETKTSGYAEVSVHSGNLFHKVQIPVQSTGDVQRIRDMVYGAQSLATQARSKR
jgi:hypothetical protein